MKKILKALAFPFVMLWIVIIYQLYDYVLDTRGAGKNIADAKRWKVFLASFKKKREENLCDEAEMGDNDFEFGDVWLEYYWRYGLLLKADIEKQLMYLAVEYIKTEKEDWGVTLHGRHRRFGGQKAFFFQLKTSQLEEVKQGFFLEIYDRKTEKPLKRIHFTLEESAGK